MGVAAGDYDGDGRPDLLSVLPAGTLRVHLGGSQSGSETFWFQPPDWECEGSGSYVPWDFDGDRYADLAIGVPFEDIGAGANAGGGHDRLMIIQGDNIENESCDVRMGRGAVLGAVLGHDVQVGVHRDLCGEKTVKTC